MKYNKETCIYLKRNRPHLNPRYKHFSQFHFTAGDEEQFFEKIFPCTFSTTSSTNAVESNPTSFYKKFKNGNVPSLVHTFRYLFYKLKKGIFIRIQNNKLKIFLPFSNVHYVNEWSHLIDMDTKPNVNINVHKCYWYGNNGLIRYEYPQIEQDSDVEIIHDMFQELCDRHSLPDMEFFVNKRDFPLLTNDETETYDNMFGKNVPLQSHNYPSYLPVLSMTTTSKHADIPIPTWEDWSRCVYFKYKKHFPSNIKTYTDTFSSILWNTKKEIAVFRGQSSGINADIKNNIRLKLCCMSHPLLDVGITKLNDRVRFNINTSNQLQNIQKDDIFIKPFLNPLQQAQYKYIINVDGHTMSYRLGHELQFGSVVLWARSQYDIWYSHLLKPYVHYVPIKEDLSDLIDQIKWCKKNDEKCKTIAINALHFYHTHLTYNRVLEYLHKKLHQISKWVGSYTYHDTSNFIYNLPFEKKYPMLEYEKKIVYKKTNSCIYRAVIRGDPTFIKKNKHPRHENQIGIHLINSLFNKHFAVTNVHNKMDTYVLTDEIEGTLFDKYLSNPTTSLKQTLSIIYKIASQLKIAQRKFHFIHNDLYAWNIIITPKGIPVIFDFDKSQFSYKRNIYTTLPFIHFNEFYDIFTLLVSTLAIFLTHHKLSFFDTQTVLKLMNILKETPLLNYFFKHILHKEQKFFLHLYEVRIFCKFVKKYNMMLYALRNGWIINLPLDNFIKQKYEGKKEYPIYDIYTKETNQKNFFNKFNNIL